MTKVLLIDDEEHILNNRSKFIKNLGYQCVTAHSGNEAIKLFEKEIPEIILTDIKMSDGDGFDVLKAAKEFDPSIPVIVFTGYGSIESAVDAMKLGAFDYIQKPVSKDMIQIMLKKASEFRNLAEENLTLKKQIKQYYKLDNVVYRSPNMTDIAKRVLKAAKSDANVFIYGETGTGKEMIARNIHLNSNRKDNPFIPLDCVALSPTLIESEIFGFEKGAFTGAYKNKPGMIELANGGTLFLDEITELETNLQAKLLRVLQEKQFRRIGGTKLIDVDVRIISATNQNLEKAIKEKKLRQDLYYRLNVVHISMPPLRERKEDIPILVQHFIEEFNPRLSNEIKGISKNAMKLLQKYDWPGNVRELRNIIEQAMSLTEKDIIDLDDLPENIQESDISFEDDSFLNLNFQEVKEKYLNQIYKKYINSLLKHYDGNISKVAQKAGVSRLTIYRIIKNMDNEQ